MTLSNTAVSSRAGYIDPGSYSKAEIAEL